MNTKVKLSPVIVTTAVCKHHQALLQELGLVHTNEADVNPVHLIRNESLLEKIMEFFIYERARLMKK